MAGLDPAIQGEPQVQQPATGVRGRHVDARVKPGHDEAYRKKLIARRQSYL
jgi:hypothetical protein